MLLRQTIPVKIISATVMIAALFLLTSANYWAYGFKKERPVAANNLLNATEEEPDAPPVPNPTEEKTSSGLQNISEYLHDHHDYLAYPVIIVAADYHHIFDRLPVHHPDVLTPPPNFIG